MPNRQDLSQFKGSSPSDIHALALEIVRLGEQSGLRYIAASADISDPAPILDSDGDPFAGNLFKWFDPDLQYWTDRTFALRSGFIQASRICAEPFYFDGSQMQTWRASRALALFNKNADYDAYGVASAIVCPCHLPFGVIGAVVWASDNNIPDLISIYDEYCTIMLQTSLKFVSAYRDVSTPHDPSTAFDLTRREIQCLKWAALGKTDSEIATIMGIAVPTIRFHLTNAGKKLGVAGRAQAVRVATNLGYIGRSVSGSVTPALSQEQ